MTETNLLWWEKMRARGRSRFIVREGVAPCVLGFGLAFLLAVPVFFALSGGSFHFSAVAIGWAVATMAFAVPTGTVGGLVLWRQHEKDFHKSTRGEHNP
jgi:hypothetical protein